MHARHAWPLVPHLEMLRAVVTQVDPSQHPCAQVVALHEVVATHAPFTHAVPPPHAAHVVPWRPHAALEVPATHTPF